MTEIISRQRRLPKRIQCMVLTTSTILDHPHQARWAYVNSLVRIHSVESQINHSILATVSRAIIAASSSSPKIRKYPKQRRDRATQATEMQRGPVSRKIKSLSSPEINLCLRVNALHNLIPIVTVLHHGTPLQVKEVKGGTNTYPKESYISSDNHCRSGSRTT